MKPVAQTRFHDPSGQAPPGNCFAACVASILECDLDDLPDIEHYWTRGCDQRRAWNDYYGATIMALRRRWSMTLMECTGCSGILLDSIGSTYVILSGPSPRYENINHSVVGINDDIVWDPHPDRTGLRGALADWEVGFFVGRLADRREILNDDGRRNDCFVLRQLPR